MPTNTRKADESLMREANARALKAPLTASALRLLAALNMFLLGWSKTEDVIARSQLRDVTGLDGRTYDRAAAQLEDALVVARTSTGKGRGTKTTWRYLSDAEADRPSLNDPTRITEHEETAR